MINSQALSDDGEGGDGPAFDGEIVQLRELRGRVHELPTADGAQVYIGRSSECQIAISDPTRMMSRRHALLSRHDGDWTIQDLKSSNGTEVDGVPRHQALLDAGDEIRLGHTTLIAESQSMLSLRGYLSRLLGYSLQSNEAVSIGMSSLRKCAARRGVLSLSGVGDLEAVAEALHRRVLGQTAPFVVFDPDAEGMSGTDAVNALDDAWRQADSGSLCLLRTRQTSLFDNVIEHFHDGSRRTQVILIARVYSYLPDVDVFSLVLPPLDERSTEVDRIITESARDACALLDLSPSLWNPTDLRAVRLREPESVTDIDEQVTRILLSRASGGLVGRVSGWLTRRRSATASSR